MIDFIQDVPKYDMMSHDVPDDKLDNGAKSRADDLPETNNVKATQGAPHSQSSDSDSGDDDSEQIAQFNSLIARGKAQTKAGNLHESLASYQSAHKLFPSDKLQRRITKIQVSCLSPSHALIF